MSEKIRLDRKIGFQNTFYTKCINVIIDSIGPSIILRSIYCAVRTWINPTLCPFLTVPWVDMQSVIIAFLGHTLSFLKL